MLTIINAELRERMAVVANDIEAVERVLDSLGYQGEAVTTPRAARIVLFYRNELREYGGRMNEVVDDDRPF